MPQASPVVLLQRPQPEDPVADPVAVAAGASGDLQGRGPQGADPVAVAAVVEQVDAGIVS